MTLTLAELTVRTLIANGIDNLYCLPGLQLDPFFDAAYDHQDKLAIIHTRHEQGAAYMATGAAIATGRPQAYCVVPGAGFLNSTAALSTALATHARVMALVGAIPKGAMGKGFGVLHEIPDGLSIMRGLTKHAEQVNSAQTAWNTIQSVVQELKSGPPGPVGLEVPTNLWNSDSAMTAENLVVAASTGSKLDTDAVERAATIISKAKSPMIVVGSGALDSARQVSRLANLLNAPVVAFRNGQGVFSANEDLHISMPIAHKLWPKVDVAIGLGTRMQTQQMAWGTDEDLKIVHITNDPDEIGRIKEPTVGICHDLVDVLPALIAQLEANQTNRQDWVDTVRTAKAQVKKAIADKIGKQIEWLTAIRDVLPPEGILIDEMTQMGYVSRIAFPVYHPRTFISPGYQGTLGYGYATALGVAHARRDVPVVNFCGDGGALFTLNELATGMLHEIPLTTVIFADGHYGNVRGLQRDNYNGRFIASELSNPDFVKYAEAFGAQGMRATTPDELREKLAEGIAHPGPTLIEVPVGEFNSPWEFILMPKVRGK